jgi:hypothetical protein
VFLLSPLSPPLFCRRPHSSQLVRLLRVTYPGAGHGDDVRGHIGTSRTTIARGVSRDAVQSSCSSDTRNLRMGGLVSVLVVSSGDSLMTSFTSQLQRRNHPCESSIPSIKGPLLNCCQDSFSLVVLCEGCLYLLPVLPYGLLALVLMGVRGQPFGRAVQ